MTELEYTYIEDKEDLYLYVYSDGSYILKHNLAVLPLSGYDMKALIKFLKKARRREIWTSVLNLMISRSQTFA